MKALFIAGFFAAVFSRPALAVQDLVDIYNLSVQSNPVLMAQAAAQRATEELADQADAAFLPQVDMVANNSKVWTDSSSQRFGGSSEYNDHGYTLSLVQPIYRRNNFVQSRQAEFAIEGAAADYQFAEQDLIVRVADRYFAVLGAEDDLSFALAELEAIEKQLEQADQRFEVGLATIIDVTEARAAYDLATAAIIEAENLLANAREALRETAGQYPSELAELKEETPLVKPEPENIEEWSEQAIVMNPVLQSANSNVGLAKENIEFERSGHYPTLDLVAQKGYTSQSDSKKFWVYRSIFLSMQVVLLIQEPAKPVSDWMKRCKMKKNSVEQLYVRPVPPITASCQASAGSMRCSRRYIPIKRHWSRLKRVLMSAHGQQ